jgi:hypothetical protein
LVHHLLKLSFPKQGRSQLLLGLLDQLGNGSLREQGAVEEEDEPAAE